MQILLVICLRPICHLCELRVVTTQKMTVERAIEGDVGEKRNGNYSPTKPLVIHACFNIHDCNYGNNFQDSNIL